jgi:hypothetical protein
LDIKIGNGISSDHLSDRNGYWRWRVGRGKVVF